MNGGQTTFSERDPSGFGLWTDHARKPDPLHSFQPPFRVVRVIRGETTPSQWGMLNLRAGVRHWIKATCERLYGRKTL